MAEGFKDRYDDYMAGRNGGDALSLTCLIAGLLLVLLSFACVGINPFLYLLVLVLGLAAAVYAAIRMTSRDVAARQAENEAFVGIFKRFGRKEEDEEPRATRRDRAERPSRRSRAVEEDEDFASDDMPEDEPEPEPAPAQPEKVMVACDNCGQQLRVPAGKGNIKVRCPKCSNVFQLFT